LSCYVEDEEENSYKRNNKFTKNLNISDKKLPSIKERTLDGFLRTNQAQGNYNGNIE